MPRLDRLLVALDRTAGGYLQAAAHSVQQIRHPAQGLTDAEPALDQSGDSGQGPSGVFPAVRDRAFVQRAGQLMAPLGRQFSVGAAGPAEVILTIT